MQSNGENGEEKLILMRKCGDVISRKWCILYTIVKK